MKQHIRQRKILQGWYIVLHWNVVDTATKKQITPTEMDLLLEMKMQSQCSHADIKTMADARVKKVGSKV